MNYCEYNGFFDGKTALVTGGAGFIGSHLTQHLGALGCHVRVLDDFSTGHATNIEGMGAECIEGSILDVGVLQHVTRGCQFIFHLAAFVSVPQSIQTPETCFNINVRGTECVIEAAEHAGCNRVIFASSAACYGSHPHLPSSEKDPVSLESPYAETKYAGEQLVASNKGMDGVSLRYFNVFGQRQDPSSQYAAVVCAFKESLEQNRLPVVFGDGSQTRDFTAVENVVHANLLAAFHPKPLRGVVLNVGTGTSMSLLALLDAMSGDDALAISYEPEREGDVQHSCADITAIVKTLAYSSVVSTTEALASLLNPTQQ